LIEITAVPPLSGVEDDGPVRVDSEALVESRFASYLADESGLGPGRAETIFFPTFEKQVADFLREMNQRKMAVTLSGGRTGIVGGAVPHGGALLSLDGMNRIVGIRWDERSNEWRVTVQPGIRLKDFQDRISKKDLVSWDVSSDPGWKDLPRFLTDPHRYFYPPDPTEDSASLGGTVATDASGARTYLFGRTRNHVRALRGVLATGDVLEIRRGENWLDSSRTVRIKSLDGSVKTIPIPSYESPHAKSTAGYLCMEKMDLIDLFIGSEGTLGVITLIEVALTVAPAHIAMFLAFFPSEDDAVGFVIRVRSLKDPNASLRVHSLEYLDHNSLDLLRKMRQDGGPGAGIKLPDEKTVGAILCEFSYQDLAEAVGFLQKPLEDFHSSLDNAVTGMDERTIELLKQLRHAIPESINKIVAQRKKQVQGMHKIGTDTSVPDEKLELMVKSYSQILKASNLEYYVFGHVAENHLHVNVLPRNQEELTQAERLAEELAREAVAFGGTVSAEHGIGKMKKHLLRLMFSESALNEMIATKRALDPNMILSPGNVFEN
jgi:D-lactate dehydrogenase (cytochrome)